MARDIVEILLLDPSEVAFLDFYEGGTKPRRIRVERGQEPFIRIGEVQRIEGELWFFFRGRTGRGRARTGQKLKLLQSCPTVYFRNV